MQDYATKRLCIYRQLPRFLFQRPLSSASKLFSATLLCKYKRPHWLIFNDPIEMLRMGDSYLTPSPAGL